MLTPSFLLGGGLISSVINSRSISDNSSSSKLRRGSFFIKWLNISTDPFSCYNTKQNIILINKTKFICIFNINHHQDSYMKYSVATKKETVSCRIHKIKMNFNFTSRHKVCVFYRSLNIEIKKLQV